ncbi:MAG TPA: DUF1206 domain-containing protein [Caldilineaceae bacterium]|nr:DUF1206 domain-containing protein [Caldilineaceae bacterium]
MSAGSEIRKAQAELRAASTEAIPWVVWLARFGYAVKGLVYLLIGVFAVQAAIGAGGRITGPEGAIASIGRQPFGQVLLGLAALGLFGYALWRFVQAWVDPERKGKDAKGIVQRLGYAASGVVYAGFGFYAVRLLMGAASSAEGQSGGSEDWTASLMAQPFGLWLVALAGLIIIGAGVYQFYEGITARFRDDLMLHEMSDEEIKWSTRAGRMGYVARGVIYAIIGGFLVLAAWRSNPEEAGGIGEALSTLASQPYGPWLLGLVGAGLIGYGLFAFVLARYRRIFVT